MRALTGLLILDGLIASGGVVALIYRRPFLGLSAFVVAYALSYVGTRYCSYVDDL